MPSPSSTTVCLACTREQEQVWPLRLFLFLVLTLAQAMYLDIKGATEPVEELTRLCSLLPIHLVLGLQNDFMYALSLLSKCLIKLETCSPRSVHEALLDPASGRRYASLREEPDVGHLVRGLLILPWNHAHWPINRYLNKSRAS